MRRSWVIVAAVLAAPPAMFQAQSAMQLDPQRESAISAEQSGNNSEAESRWREYLKEHPRSAEANAHIGLLEAHEGHMVDAITYYRHAFRIDPNMRGLRLNLGLALFKNGDPDGAAEMFSSLLKSDRLSSAESQQAKTLLGMSYYGEGKYAAAVPLLKSAAANDTSSLWIRLALAQSCLGAKQFQCVLDTYHEMLNLNAESAEVDMLAAEALDEMKDHPGAIEQFRAAVKADPKLPNAHFGLGYVLWTQNQYDEAAAEFESELQNVPEHPQALTYLADVDIKLGKDDAAFPLLEEAIRIDPSMPLAHLDLGILYADQGKTVDALSQMRAAEHLNPADQMTHWRLARFLKSIGKTQEASVEFEKTKTLQRVADQSVFDKLHPRRDDGKGRATPVDAPVSR